ncbi:hypothetical protein [Clostridium perfringens]|nr:hypothetical protein [Clostridium perfringens]MCX0400588.1 hypothetical protein [Clostridium perfringens]
MEQNEREERTERIELDPRRNYTGNGSRICKPTYEGPENPFKKKDNSDK